MTERRILFSLKRIEASRKANDQMETLLRLYHLNISVLKFITLKLEAMEFDEELKPKHMIDQLIAQVEEHAYLKTYITKKNIKTLKPYLTKVDAYIKTLKTKEPSNTKQLIAESEKILAILKVSASKIFANKNTSK